MSLKAMPLLFLNMGGEMIYILDQRLKAQDIHQGKAEKVLDDILGLMYTGRFVEELFRPQPLYSAQGLRTIFYRLAHSSIMRLNKSSMDKLYDLMVMVFKYQVEQCASPQQLLLVTLNHLDRMAEYATAPRVQRQVDAAYHLLVQCYGNLSAGEMQDIRYEILNFFLDYRVKVSIFLKDKRQNPNGNFVIDISGPLPEGVPMPGEIRYFDERGEICDAGSFPLKDALSAPLKPASLAKNADRGTELGTNIYSCEEGEAAPSGSRPSTDGGAPVVGTRQHCRHLERVMQDMTVDVSAGDQPDLLHMMDATAE
ncbi:protein OSCP1-like [Pollicipes pollicipes]|uniref:protein OSCP1-like n=1 Tax=Pollicipes pollicipes TaxID=41117 RepID=UPI00188542A9|nr:protein OSCP1-like [Pollicipes pollicipes]